MLVPAAFAIVSALVVNSVRLDLAPQSKAREMVALENTSQRAVSR
jgi:hypothetical protein